MSDSPDPEKPYTVREVEGRHEVVDAELRTVFTTPDPATAGHLASLLNSAFRQGFRAAQRKGRNPP